MVRRELGFRGQCCGSSEVGACTRRAPSLRPRSDVWLPCDLSCACLRILARLLSSHWYLVVESTTTYLVASVVRLQRDKKRVCTCHPRARCAQQWCLPSRSGVGLVRRGVVSPPLIRTRGTRGVLPTSTTTTAEAVTSSSVRVHHETESAVNFVTVYRSLVSADSCGQTGYFRLRDLGASGSNVVSKFL